MTRRGIAVALALLVTALVPAAANAQPAASDSLRAGAAKSDITPDLGRPAGGYVRPDITINGVATRLFARAVVLRRGDEKLALVVADLQGIPGSLQRDVAARLAGRGFARSDVIISATHTHAGPGDDIGGTPPVEALGGFFAERIALAVERADRALVPAAAGWGTAPRTDASTNRSLEALLANFGLDIEPHQGSLDQLPGGPLQAIDPQVRVLRVDRVLPGGRTAPFAVWSQFSAHSTTFTPYNHLYASDYPGVAARRLEARLGKRGRAPIVALANGNEGDQSPVYAGYNPPAAADEAGRRVALALEQAWRRAKTSTTPSLAGRATVFCFCGQETAGGRVDSEAWMGASFFGGAEDGPSIFYDSGTEGRRLPALLADPVQGRKIKQLRTGEREKFPAQVRRVGDVLIATAPGEASVEAGRRFRAAVAGAAGVSSEKVVLAGLTDDYLGYFTTPEEYDQQHYEGGFTPYGKYQSNLLQEVLGDLAGRLTRGEPAPAPAAELAAPEPRGSEITQGDGGAAGALVEQPPARIGRMRVAQMSWTGGPRGLDRPLDSAFIELQRGVPGRARGGRRVMRFRTADTDLGLNFLWRFDSNGNRYTARYDVPIDLRSGTYRFRIHSKRYRLTTRRVRITPSGGLVLRGVRATGRRVAIYAQNPAPDSSRNIRIRPMQPTGGTLRLRAGRRTVLARYRRGAWRAVLPAPPGPTLRVPKGALRDGLGNRSGRARTLRVGEIAPVSWPAPIPIAGGPVPGAGGIGTQPPGTPPGPPPDPSGGSPSAASQHTHAAAVVDHQNHAGAHPIPRAFLPLIPPGANVRVSTAAQRRTERYLVRLLLRRR